jgi:hypothetical protein
VSTIKVDTYLTRGGASEIAIDKLKGASSAASISVVAEGGTNTTNLQQGLLKAWGNFDGSGTVGTNDSFNMASLTDNSTGNYTVNIANDLANANGCMSGYSIMDGLCYGDVNDVSSAGTFRMRVVVGHTNALMDPDEFHVQIAGDLA